MNNESKKPTNQITSQYNENAPITHDNLGSHQNRSGIMDNAPGKSDEIFEEQNVPSEGEVENIDNNPNVEDDKTGFKETEDPEEVNDDIMDDSEINEADEDFDSIENDLNDTDLDDNALEDLDNEDDIDEESDEDDPLM